ncbi:hypothetical protein Emag_006914 [Eimeria magna]
MAWERPGFLVKRLKIEPDEAENISSSAAQKNRGPKWRGLGGAPGGPLQNSTQIEVIDITSLTDTSEEEVSQPLLSKRAPLSRRPPGRGPPEGGSGESPGALKGPPRARKRGGPAGKGVVSTCSSSVADAGGSPSEGGPLSDGGDTNQEGGPLRKAALAEKKALAQGPPKAASDAFVIVVSSSEEEEAIPEASLKDDEVSEVTPTTAAQQQLQQQQQQQQGSRTPLDDAASCEGPSMAEEATVGWPIGSLVRSGEKPRLFEYIREFWSEGGPAKAVVSLTFSNFSSAASLGLGGPSSSGKRRSGGPPNVVKGIKEEGQGLVSKVSCLTGDAFLPIDRAYAHRVYGDYITLTRELTKKRCNRKQQRQQQQQQQQQGEEEEVEAVWETASSTWYLEGQGGTGAARREVKAAEVRALLEHFGLELANPAVYLSQELAKTFLFRASEHSLYRFYLCASGLNSALDSLLVATERHQSALRELKAFEETLLPAREAHAKLQRELDQCKQAGHLYPAS